MWCEQMSYRCGSSASTSWRCRWFRRNRPAFGVQYGPDSINGFRAFSFIHRVVFLAAASLVQLFLMRDSYASRARFFSQIRIPDPVPMGAGGAVGGADSERAAAAGGRDADFDPPDESATGSVGGAAGQPDQRQRMVLAGLEVWRGGGEAAVPAFDGEQYLRAAHGELFCEARGKRAGGVEVYSGTGNGGASNCGADGDEVPLVCGV